MRRPTTVLALLAFAAHAAAADLTVGPAGSGADFSDIQSAIDAAGAFDDTIFVLPGTYSGSLVIHKDVDLVGADSGSTLLVPTVVDSVAEPHLTIRDLPPGRRVRVAGFGCVDPVGPGGLVVAEVGVVVEGCLGPVTLADLTRSPVEPGENSSIVDVRLLDVVDSRQVLLDRCLFNAALAAPSVPGPGARALVATRSSLWINASELLGGEAASGDGGPAIELDASRVFLSGTTAIGGSGSVDLVRGLALPSVGGPGARLSNGSRLELSGSNTARVIGGSGGLLVGRAVTPGAGGPGVLLGTGSSALLSGGVVVEGGTSGDGSQPAPPSVADGTSDLFFAVEPRLGVRLDRTLAGPGEVFRIDVAGRPSSTVGLFLGPKTIPPLSLSGYVGAALIAPESAFELAFVRTDRFGSASASIQVPLNSPPGLRGYIQAVDLGPDAAPVISLPAFVQVGG